MTMQKLTAIDLLSMPPVEFEAAFDAMPSAQRGELARELDAITQRAAFASGYANHRYGNGCGDQGHDDAMGNARRTLKRVRKVLGYTYP